MKKAYLLIAGAMVVAPAAHAQLLDGSFETKGAAGTSTVTPLATFCYDDFAAGDGVCADQSNWKPWGAGVIRSGNTDWGGTLAADGKYYAFIQNGALLTQTFTVGASGTYSLSWMDAGRNGWGGIQSYEVGITGGSLPISLGSFTTNHTDWQSQGGAPFALDKGTSYTLTFAGLTPWAPGNDSTSFVDQLSLNTLSTTAVPEPATWALMIGGFGLAGGMLRRRAGQGALRAA